MLAAIAQCLAAIMIAIITLLAAACTVMAGFLAASAAARLLKILCLSGKPGVMLDATTAVMNAGDHITRQLGNVHAVAMVGWLALMGINPWLACFSFAIGFMLTWGYVMTETIIHRYAPNMSPESRDLVHNVVFRFIFATTKVATDEVMGAKRRRRRDENPAFGFN